jgi:hypothetical protein
MVQTGVGTDLLASSFFDFDALDAAPLAREPFPFLVVPNFIRPAAFRDIVSDFPRVPGAGSFPPDALAISHRFQTLLDELGGSCFQQAIERKFGLDLAARPKMLTLRGHARRKDGTVHTDTSTKLISVLLYMNQEWSDHGGRLRLLRSPNLEEAVVEILPVGGTLLAFRRSESSWHGHAPYAGPRQVIQLNWMTGESVVFRERGRHFATAAFKKISRFFSI